MTENNLFTGMENFLSSNGLLNNPSESLIEKEHSIEGEKMKGDSEEDKKPEGLTLDEIESLTKAPVTTEEEVIEAIKAEKITPETVTDKQEDVVDADASVEVFKAVSEMFKEHGLVDDVFDSADKMIEVFGKKIEEEVEDYKNSLPDVVKNIINNYEDGVDLRKLIETKASQIEYASIEDSALEEDEDLAKALVKDYLSKTTRYSDEKIKKEIKRLEDLGELVDEAKAAKTELVGLEKEYEKRLVDENKKAQEQARKENEKIVKEIHKTITSTKEIIPGLKVNDKELEELFKMVTTPAEVRGNQPVTAAMLVREKDPIAFDLKLNYLIKKGAFEDNWDFIMKKAETKAVGKLEKQIEESAKKLMEKNGRPAQVLGTKAEETLKGLASVFGKK